MLKPKLSVMWGHPFRALLGVAALALATPVLADPLETGVGGTNSSGDALIAEAHAEGVFEALPATQMIAVLHTRSGLVCRLDPGNTNRLVIFTQAARGEDVACDSTDGRATVTLYATRFSFDTTLQEQIDTAETAIRQRYPDARPYSATVAEAADTSAPASRTTQFLVSRSDGARMYTRACVALINGWSIKLRYTVLAPDDAAIQQGQLVSGQVWRAALNEIAATPGA